MTNNNPFKFIISLVFLITLLSGCQFLNRGSEAAPTRPLPVEFLKVQRGNLNIEKEVMGRLMPEKEIIIVPTIPGRVEKVHITLGQWVIKGDILYEIEGKEIQEQVNQAQRAYDGAKEGVDFAMVKGRELQGQLNQINANISGMTLGLQKIDEGIEQINGILGHMEERIITVGFFPSRMASSREDLLRERERLETQRDQLSSSREELIAARQSIKEGLDSIPKEGELKAQLSQAKQGLNMALNAMENLKVRAPINGIVGSLNVNVGSIATQTMPSATIIDTTNLILTIPLTERDVGKVRLNQEITVTVENSALKHKGTIISISPTPDIRTMMYPTNINIKNNGNSLRPGSFAKANLILESKSNVITIPKGSIIHDGEKTYVFVVQKDMVRKRELKTGLDNGEYVEIIEGLEIDEEVVLRGQVYLEDKDKVEVIRGGTN